MKELEKIDPAAVKRANTFFPFGPPKPPADAKTSSEVDMPRPTLVGKEPLSGPIAQAVTDKPAGASKRGASANAGAAPAAAVREKPPIAPNRWVLLGVTALSAVGLLVVQWTLLAGGRR
jgi:hypothetical protein